MKKEGKKNEKGRGVNNKYEGRRRKYIGKKIRLVWRNDILQSFIHCDVMNS
jgi:hypothetical protein